MSIRRFASLVALCVCLAWGSLTARADNPIATFTAGDVVVLRGGDATNPDTTSSTNQVSLYLDEYTPSGNYVGTMDVPSSGANALTLPSIGDFQHQGVLSLSTNGQVLSFAGYQAAAGSPDADALTGTNQYQAVVGSVGQSASSLNTSTLVNSYGPNMQTPTSQAPSTTTAMNSGRSASMRPAAGQRTAGWPMSPARAQLRPRRRLKVSPIGATSLSPKTNSTAAPAPVRLETTAPIRSAPVNRRPTSATRWPTIRNWAATPAGSQPRHSRCSTFPATPTRRMG